jgi:hypothetical protein
VAAKIEVGKEVARPVFVAGLNDVIIGSEWLRMGDYSIKPPLGMLEADYKQRFDVAGFLTAGLQYCPFPADTSKFDIREMLDQKVTITKTIASGWASDLYQTMAANDFILIPDPLNVHYELEKVVLNGNEYRKAPVPDVLITGIKGTAGYGSNTTEGEIVFCLGRGVQLYRSEGAPMGDDQAMSGMHELVPTQIVTCTGLISKTINPKKTRTEFRMGPRYDGLGRYTSTNLLQVDYEKLDETYTISGSVGRVIWKIFGLAAYSDPLLEPGPRYDMKIDAVRRVKMRCPMDEWERFDSVIAGMFEGTSGFGPNRVWKSVMSQVSSCLGGKKKGSWETLITPKFSRKDRPFLDFGLEKMYWNDVWIERLERKVGRIDDDVRKEMMERRASKAFEDPKIRNKDLRALWNKRMDRWIEDSYAMWKANSFFVKFEFEVFPMVNAVVRRMHQYAQALIYGTEVPRLVNHGVWKALEGVNSWFDAHCRVYSITSVREKLFLLRDRVRVKGGFPQWWNWKNKLPGSVLIDCLFGTDPIPMSTYYDPEGIFGDSLRRIIRDEVLFGHDWKSVSRWQLRLILGQVFEKSVVQYTADVSTGGLSFVPRSFGIKD